MSPPALTYRGKVDTVENLARTLIVASAVHPQEGSFNLPLTVPAARALGRALEWAMEIDRSHAARKADADRRIELARALLAEVEVVSVKNKALVDSAEKALASALSTNVRSLVQLVCSAVFCVAGAAFWWLA